VGLDSLSPEPVASRLRRGCVTAERALGPLRVIQLNMLHGFRASLISMHGST
jgi:hypothetical protein